MIKMNPFFEIKAKLAKFPQLKLIEGENNLIIYPVDETGFKIEYIDHGENYTVKFEEWEQSFITDEFKSSLNCLGFGLSKFCRLKVYSKKGLDFKWEMESYIDGNWKQNSSKMIPNNKFWQRTKVRILSNNLMQ